MLHLTPVFIFLVKQTNALEQTVLLFALGAKR
jgi:hypothetical protein